MSHRFGYEDDHGWTVTEIPPLLFGPLIGVYLDRLPKKAVMVWVDILRALLTFLIFSAPCTSDFLVDRRLIRSHFSHIRRLHRIRPRIGISRSFAGSAFRAHVR